MGFAAAVIEIMALSFAAMIGVALAVVAVIVAP